MIEINGNFVGQLYHACDSDFPQSYCLLNVNVLQFGDFYSAILAFWVTLITLANMPDLCRAFFHLFGGIVIAFTVETDRTSLWAFALPAGIGAVILIISWVSQKLRLKYFQFLLIKFQSIDCSVLSEVMLSFGKVLVIQYFAGNCVDCGRTRRLCLLRDSRELCHYSQV